MRESFSSKNAEKCQIYRFWNLKGQYGSSGQIYQNKCKKGGNFEFRAEINLFDTYL